MFLTFLNYNNLCRFLCTAFLMRTGIVESDRKKEFTSVVDGGGMFSFSHVYLFVIGLGAGGGGVYRVIGYRRFPFSPLQSFLDHHHPVIHHGFTAMKLTKVLVTSIISSLFSIPTRWISSWGEMDRRAGTCLGK